MSSRAVERIKRSVLFAFVAVSTLQTLIQIVIHTMNTYAFVDQNLFSLFIYFFDCYVGSCRKRR